MVKLMNDSTSSPSPLSPCMRHPYQSVVKYRVPIISVKPHSSTRALVLLILFFNLSRNSSCAEFLSSTTSSNLRISQRFPTNEASNEVTHTCGSLELYVCAGHQIGCSEVPSTPVKIYS